MRQFILIATITLFVFSNLSAQANLDSGLVAYYPFNDNVVSLENGSFEFAAVDPGNWRELPNGSTAINGWIVTNGPIDYVGTLWIASEGSRSIDLNSSTPSAISQSFKTLKDSVYQVQFDMAGHPDGGPSIKRLRVSAADSSQEFTFTNVGKTRQNMGWQEMVFQFIAIDTITTLTFSSLIPGPYGPTIDNIRISRNDTAENYALAFDGINDIVRTTLRIDQSATSAGVTMEAWVYPTSNSSGRHQLISSDNGNFDWSILREGGQWHVFNGSGSYATGFAVDLNQWQHIAAVFTPNVGVRFYKNGQEFLIPTISYEASDSPIAIGDNPEFYVEFFAGVIDEVRVWNRVRTQAEIQATMNTSLSGSEPGLAGYWAFDEGQGATTMDGTGRGNNGVIDGAGWVASTAPIAKSNRDIVPPDAPQRLTAAVDSSRVTLTWNPNTDPDLLRYRIYRSTNYPTFTLHNSVLANTTTFVDSGLDPNIIYFYRITAVDSVLNESGFSNEVSSFVPQFPDLQVTRVEAPPNASSGQLIQVNWIVTNNGNDGTKAPVWYDDVFLSPTQNFDPQTATHLGRFENFSALNANEAYANSATFTLPRGISGDYYIFVRADIANHERESNEGNNQSVSPPLQVELSPFPDLQVISITAPSNAFSGDSLQVSWTVQNTKAGRTEADTWFDTIFLSADDTLDFDFIGGSRIRINETPLGLVTHRGALDSGATYTAVAKIKLPHAISGRHTIFVYADINGGQTQSERGLVYEYDFELNNFDSTVITLTLAPAPDLEVTEATAPASANLGEDAGVQWRVINHGPGAPFENSWQDRIYLSRTPALNPDSATVLAAFTRTGSLLLDSSYTASRTVRIPNGFAGENYIFVHTDWNNGVFEYQADGNNVSLPTRLVIDNPDFEVRSVIIPSTANSGKSFEITWNVTNSGPGAVFNAAWNDRVYLSRQPVFDVDSAAVLGAFSRSGALHKDSSYTVTRSFMLPNGIAGDYYVFVETDADNRVFENQNESDNRDRGPNVMRVQLSPWADLQVDSIITPDSLMAGERLAVTWTVANRSVAAAEGTWIDRVYLSSGMEWNPNNATLIASAERAAGLAAGATYTQSRNVTLSTNLSGTYFVTVQTDANNNVYEHTDEGNNLAHSRPIAVASYPPSDLLMSDFSAPDSALSGNTITVKWTVTNIRLATTLAQGWVDELYFSDDAQLDPNRDLLMATVARSSVLRSNESYTRQSNLTLANGFFGNYFLIIVSDAGNAVNDANRNNNVVVSNERIHIALAPSPDLTVTELRLPQQVNAGQPLLLVYTVANRGNGGLSNRSWYDAVYLSQNATLDNADVALAAQPRNLSLSANATYIDSLEVEMPGHASGTYFLIMKTDSRNEIYEHNAELNNVRVGDSTGVTPIVITQPAPADLIVSDITIPANAIPGEEVTISWMLKNIGENRATGRLRDAVYISSDTLYQVEDPVFGVLTHNIDLPPDSSQKMSMKVNLAQLFRADAEGNLTEELPGLTPGQYHALVRTDIRRNIRESNTSNNALASADLMNTDVPELRLGVPMTGTLEAGKNLYYRVNVDADLDLRLNLTSNDSSASNEIYIAYGRIPTLADFDFAGRVPLRGKQELLVPSTQIGSYYVMVTAAGRAMFSNDFLILAKALPFSVTEMFPNYGGSGGRVTTVLRGSKFGDSTKVFLQITPDSLLSPQEVRLKNSTELIVLWNLMNVPAQVYDVVVRSLSTQKILDISSEEIILHDFFEVQALRAIEIATDISGPTDIRAGTNATYAVKVINNGNVDADYVLLSVAVPSFQKVEIVTNDFRGRPVPQEVFDGYKDPIAGLKVGGVGIVAGMAKNLPPGQALYANVMLQNVHPFSPNMPISINADVLTKNEFLYREFVTVSLLRKEVLNMDVGSDLPELPDLRHELTSEDWDSIYVKNLEQFELLSNMPLRAPTMPLKYDPSNEWIKDEPGIKPFTCEDHVEAFTLAADVILNGIALRGLIVSGFTLFPTVGFIAGAGVTGIALYDYICQLDGTECLTLYDNFVTQGTPFLFDFLEILEESDKLTLASLVSGSISLAADPICAFIRFSLDPNDITGPAGFGDERWITATQTLPYTIRFENDSTRATAAAQVVSITQKLDSTLDSRSFRLGSFGFANLNFTVSENRAFYSERLDVRDSLGVFVDVTAGIDIITNEAFWIFRAIDPSTGQLPVFNGFLPVNDAQHRGEGFANYTIRPKRDTKTGDVVRAKARIIFDTNEPIDTPEIFNTIDAVVPQSRVTALPTALNSTTLTVSWSGADDTTGSKIRDFALYVSTDGKPFELFEEGIADTSLVFSGDFGSTYRFFTIVRDNAGNVEVLKSAAEATVTLDPTVSVAENPAELPKTFELYQNYPNPFNPTTIIKYDLPVPSEVKLEIFDILGRRVRVLVDTKQNAGFHSALWDGKTVAGRSVATGVYFYRIEAKGFVKARKMLVVR